jgi:plastocyanin
VEVVVRIWSFGVSTLVVSALILSSACGDAGGTSGSKATIEIVDNAFSPGTLRVKVGTTVTWQWKGKNTHSVVGTFEGQDYNSGDHTGAGFSASHKFAAAGTYQYVCGFHGGSMPGTVIVE